VAASPPKIAEALTVAPGTALLRIDRTYYDTAGDPVELAVSHFHPDRYSYRVRLRRHVV
jgi:GntR family transcriptional regulator